MWHRNYIQMGYGKQGLKLEWPDCSLFYVISEQLQFYYSKQKAIMHSYYCIEVQDFDMPNVIELATNH